VLKISNSNTNCQLGYTPSQQKNKNNMQNQFKSIGIISKSEDCHSCQVTHDLCQIISDSGGTIFIEESTHTTCDLTQYHHCSIEDLGRHCDLVIVIGGDGTLLCTARHLTTHDIPLVGINRGRLGFLVDISPKDLRKSIMAILTGQYLQESRHLLTMKVERDGKTLHQADAFNDVVISKWNTASMIEFDTMIDDHYLLTQRSDGMIISTPTGSTAYSLSGGGPIMHPAVDATLLVPICPHTLNNRPIVVHGSSKVTITFNPLSSPEVQVSCDGQDEFILQKSDTVVVQQKPEPIRLLHPPGYDYFSVLRAKLHWGGASTPRSEC
jgi:NAD+ kinase